MLEIWTVLEQPSRSATIEVQIQKNAVNRSRAYRRLDVNKHLNISVVRIRNTELARIRPFLQ